MDLESRACDLTEPNRRIERFILSSPECHRESPKNVHRYRAWWIIGAAAATMTATLPGRTHGIGLVTQPLLQELNLDDVGFGAINLASILIGSSFCRPTGWAVDRFGAGAILQYVAVLLGLVVFLTSRVSAWPMLLALLILTRGLAQGSLSVISTTLIGKGMTSEVPKAMGIYAALMGVGMALSVTAMSAAIEFFGWRNAWAALGATIVVGLVPLGRLMSRWSVDAPRTLDASELEDATPAVAVSMPAFWLVTGATCLFGFAWSGITLYNQLLLAERGFASYHFFRMIPVLIVGSLAGNVLGSRLAARSIAAAIAAEMGLFVFALLSACLMTESWQLYVYGFAFGVAAGLNAVVQFSFFRLSFGRQHLGKIHGIYQTCFVVSTAFGPLSVALSRHWTGTYGNLFLLLIPVAILLAVGALLTRFPQKVTSIAQ